MIIVPFLPKHKLDTISNMNAYIRHIKDNAIFFRGEGCIDWGCDKWDLTSYYPTTGNVKTKAIFTDVGYQNGKPFPQPFMDEAKALIADFLRQNNTRQVSDLISVVRHVYQALPISEKGRTLNDLSDIELYSIEASLSSNSSDPYKYCRYLERFVHDIIEPAKLTKSRLSWKSGIKYKALIDLIWWENAIAQ